MRTVEELEEYCKGHELLWLCPESVRIARLAVGGVIDFIRANIEGRFVYNHLNILFTEISLSSNFSFFFLILFKYLFIKLVLFIYTQMMKFYYLYF